MRSALIEYCGTAFVQAWRYTCIDSACLRGGCLLPPRLLSLFFTVTPRRASQCLKADYRDYPRGRRLPGLC